MCTHMYTLIYTETHVKAPNFYEIEASGHKLFLLKKKIQCHFKSGSHSIPQMLKGTGRRLSESFI